MRSSGEVRGRESTEPDPSERKELGADMSEGSGSGSWRGTSMSATKGGEKGGEGGEETARHGSDRLRSSPNAGCSVNLSPHHKC